MHAADVGIVAHRIHNEPLLTHILFDDDQATLSETAPAPLQ